MDIGSRFSDYGVALKNLVPSLVEDGRFFCELEGMVFEMRPQEGHGLFYIGYTRDTSFEDVVRWTLEREDERQRSRRAEEAEAPRTVLRRRCEDAMRKTASREDLLGIASLLGVKTTE